MRLIYAIDSVGPFIGTWRTDSLAPYDYTLVTLIACYTEENGWVRNTLPYVISINLSSLITWKYYENYEDLMEEHFEAFI
jgi:hypothetical protein